MARNAAKKVKRLYSYRGAVYLWDRLSDSRWTASTFAVSEKQARNNMAHQYKSGMGLMPNARVTLPDKVTCEA